MRRNDDGSIYTFPARVKSTGETVLVDDRTFDQEIHDSGDPLPDAADVGAKVPAKGKKAK